MGEAESTRVRILERNIRDQFYSQVAANQPTVAPCPVYTQSPLQMPTVPNQLSHTLDKAIACSITYTNPPSLYDCQSATSKVPVVPPLGAEPLKGPAVSVVQRKFSRIGGIDEICRFPLSRSSSGHTARIRTGIESQNTTRYALTVIPRIPYPPYLPPAPNTGVPLPSISGCERRVGFSNPRA